MKNKFGSFYAIGFLAGFLLAPETLRAQSAVDYSRQLSEQPSVSEQRPLPLEAVAISDEELKAAAPVTFDELLSFVKDWRKYSRWLKSGGNEYKAVAYLGVSRSADYPPEVVKWMDSHGWAVDRFFLLEYKFRRTLAVQKQEARQILLRQQADQIMEQAKNDKTLSREERKNLKNKYTSMVRHIRSSSGAKAPVTPEEYDLIKINRSVLDRVLAE